MKRRWKVRETEKIWDMGNSGEIVRKNEREESKIGPGKRRRNI